MFLGYSRKKKVQSSKCSDLGSVGQFCVSTICTYYINNSKVLVVIFLFKKKKVSAHAQQRAQL